MRALHLLKNLRPRIKNILSIRRTWFRKLVISVWVVFLGVTLGLPAYIGMVRVDLFGLFGGFPDFKEIENPENDLSSELISADGVSLGRYFRYNRSQVRYEELSHELVNALLVSEDHRFYKHSGVDVTALLRALKGRMLLTTSQGGGSTITQQLAKNLFTRNRDSDLDGPISTVSPFTKRIVQKTKEWIISIQLEKNFTKEEIIAMYLNTSEFSNNAYGIKIASQTYFDTTPDRLTQLQSAVLVGMLQNPSLFNPKAYPGNALKKRNEVLFKLLRHNQISSRKVYDSLRELPIELTFQVQNHNTGLAQYFRTEIQKDLIPWCKANGYDLLSSGLKIYTTIDSRMQRYAEEAVSERMSVLQKEFISKWGGKKPWTDESGKEIEGFLSNRITQTPAYKKLLSRYGKDSDSINYYLTRKRPMRIFSWEGEKDTLFSSFDSLAYYKHFLHTGFMATDATTGGIKAWVGGINFRYFQYDHVRQGTNQPGSTFKPFVFGLAMENGYSPCYELLDLAPTFMMEDGKQWSPSNSNGTKGSGEKMSLRQALALSINSITAQLIKNLGAENVVEFAHRTGIKSRLNPVPSLCLGVSDVSLYELVGAYGTFVNNGVYTEPYYITRIEDKNGNIIESFTPKSRHALNEQVAYKIVYLLQGGVEITGGSSSSISSELKVGNEVGGKTGTSNNAADGWFIGITKDLVAGAWVGGDERSIHFQRWSDGQGGKTARPIWETFMLKVYKDTSLPYNKGSFKRPYELNTTLDCDQLKELPAFYDDVEF